MSHWPIDPKRTGVRAFACDFGHRDVRADGPRWLGRPGAMIPRTQGGRIIDHILACPGCGVFAVCRREVVEGSLSDVTTLTLHPSVAKGCCGWRGYLRRGVFAAAGEGE